MPSRSRPARDSGSSSRRSGTARFSLAHIYDLLFKGSFIVEKELQTSNQVRLVSVYHTCCQMIDARIAFTKSLASHNSRPEASCIMIKDLRFILYSLRGLRCFLSQFNASGGWRDPSRHPTCDRVAYGKRRSCTIIAKRRLIVDKIK